VIFQDEHDKLLKIGGFFICRVGKLVLPLYAQCISIVNSVVALA